MNKFYQTTTILTAGLLLSTLTAQAQLTWDPDLNLADDGGNGTWDTTTSNWWNGTIDTTWDNTGATEAVFGSGTYQVDLTTSGVTVGDLTYGGGGILEFKGSTLNGTAGDTITIASGGATWDTGGGEIEFFNDGNDYNTRLAMTSGDTLTVQGGGTFDTGQNPQNNANGTWQVSGATLDVTSATTVIGHAASIGEFETVKLAAGSTYIHERNANQSYANNWELGGGTITFSNRFTGNGNTTLNGTLTGNIDEFVVDMGAGNRIITFTQANTALTAGLFRIGEGQVNITNDNAISNSVLVLGGISGKTSRLNLLGNDLAIKGLYNDIGGTREIRNNAGNSTAVVTIDVDTGESYSFNANVNSSNATGKIDFVKTGEGEQIFNRAAGYTRAIGNLTANGGNLVWRVATGEIDGAISIGASGTLQVGTGDTVGTIDNKNVANDGTLFFNRSDAVTYAGIISGDGGVKVTTGTTATSAAFTVNAAQTYKGTTTIDKSIFTAGVVNAISSESVLAIGGAGSGTSAFDMNGLDQQAGGLSFISGSHTREVQNNGASTATLTLNVAIGESYQWNANFNGTNAINIIKTGDGTQIFGRNGGYSTALGDITVSGGELIWDNNNAATQTGTVTVNAGGTLSGSGILGGAITVSGTLSPGNSPGTMSFTEDLTLTGAATTILEFTGTGLAGEFDVLLGDTGNTLTAGGTLNLVVDGYTAVLNDTFLVFEDWASFAGSFSSINGTDLGGGLSFDTSNLLTDGTLTVVPEPSTYALLAGLLAFFAIALRRRAK
ncbi:MAG: beta strand repeat-containing protein [Opitutaceae bacterium]